MCFLNRAAVFYKKMKFWRKEKKKSTSKYFWAHKLSRLIGLILSTTIEMMLIIVSKKETGVWKDKQGADLGKILL